MVGDMSRPEEVLYLKTEGSKTGQATGVRNGSELQGGGGVVGLVKVSSAASKNTVGFMQDKAPPD